ncbi:MAG: HAMP domain-containing histidine kinase [Elusimicrobia bacterium]|nr:HAMP domain-containing histidine kinase [Elusimicrobiota bacterium]
MTIRAQVTAALCGMVAFSFLIGYGFSTLLVERSLAKASDRRYLSETRLLASLALVKAPAKELEPFMNALTFGAPVRWAYLADDENRIKLHTIPELAGRLVSEATTPLTAGTTPVSVKAESGGRKYEAVVGRWLEAERQERAEFTKGSLAAYLQLSGLGVLAGFLIAWGLGAHLTRPIEALADASRRVAAGEEAYVDDASANELGELSKQFNAMTGTLRALETLREDRMSHVSHDFRSPLAAVEMLSDFMLNQDSDRERLSPAQREKLATIHDGARRLRVFAANVLDAAKLRAGKMEYKRETVDVSAAAARAVSLFGLLAKQRGVALTSDVAAGLSASADPERFEQVLANLLSNALKYTPEGGKIAVSGERIGGKVRISVKDTGSGIDPERKAKLFTAFGVSVAAPGAIPSAGLGLFVVKKTVEGMGGAVSVDSEPGKGSTFTVELEA